MINPLILNAFLLNSPTHLNPGQARNPATVDGGYLSAAHWIGLAKRLEAGLFDGVFFADVLGAHTEDAQDLAHCMESAIQFPVHDPAPAVAIMAAVTEHLCFGLTASVFADHPYLFARKMATLDHLTQGRLGWNIVTSYLPSAMKALGVDGMSGHDQRYDYAHDHVSLCLALWRAAACKGQGRDGPLYSIAKHVQFSGEYLTFDGIPIAASSPQQVPVLFQAGASSKGLGFAAEFAECIFLAGKSVDATQILIARAVAAFARSGRSRGDYRILPQVTVVIDKTDALAWQKYKDLLPHADRRGAEILVSGWLGTPLKDLDPEKPLAQFESQAIRSFAGQFGQTGQERQLETVADIVDFALLGGLGVVLVGGPETVVAKMQALQAAGADGFNIPDIVAPSTYDDIIDFLVPALQERGLFKQSYRPGTYRQKIKTSLPG